MLKKITNSNEILLFCSYDSQLLGGFVLQIGDGIVRLFGLENVASRELL